MLPDETTILRFRHLLEKQKLTAGSFAAVNGLLTEKRLMLRTGTYVAATILAAPSSTKNATKTRDPEMKQTHKGKQWYFGMKLHVGTDARGRIHHVTATHAAGADITEMPKLLHGKERVVYGDRAYWKAADCEAFEARGVRYRVNRRAASKKKPLELALALDQSRPVAKARPRRARLPRGQAAVGFREGALPGHRQEPGTSADDVRAGEPVPRAAALAAAGGELRPVNARQGKSRDSWSSQGGVEPRSRSNSTHDPLCAVIRVTCAEVP